ncbi:MAG: Gfo/Idh/MocA family protein [Fimbriiglobus sp.]
MKTHELRAGIAGLGMIFDETYRPFFEADRHRCFVTAGELVRVRLAATASRTGRKSFPAAESFAEPKAAEKLAALDLHAICVATPDDRHFATAQAAILAGKHVLIEKPSVLTLRELDQLVALANERGVLAKVVYHKLLDPDHKKLRTLVTEGVLQHVNNGYCTLLEPKAISMGQFAEWITGRNPATYVAVHYLKLIDFTFGPAWKLTRILATGQRGLVGLATGNTWDSVQLQIVYTHPDQREATFDIHTNWVTPDNYPGYVEQEVQFRFDNAVWNAHQRKRGVELTIEGRTPTEFKNTPNYHYNGRFLEPWGETSQRGYGIEVIQRFFQEVAEVEFGGPVSERPTRLQAMRGLAYNDLAADRNCVAIVQALEALLAAQATGHPSSVVTVNQPTGLALYRPGYAEPEMLYSDPV